MSESKTLSFKPEKWDLPNNNRSSDCTCEPSHNTCTPNQQKDHFKSEPRPSEKTEYHLINQYLNRDNTDKEKMAQLYRIMHDVNTHSVSKTRSKYEEVMKEVQIIFEKTSCPTIKDIYDGYKKYMEIIAYKNLLYNQNGQRIKLHYKDEYSSQQWEKLTKRYLEFIENKYKPSILTQEIYLKKEKELEELLKNNVHNLSNSEKIKAIQLLQELCKMLQEHFDEENKFITAFNDEMSNCESEIYIDPIYIVTDNGSNICNTPEKKEMLKKYEERMSDYNSIQSYNHRFFKLCQTSLFRLGNSEKIKSIIIGIKSMKSKFQSSHSSQSRIHDMEQIIVWQIECLLGLVNCNEHEMQKHLQLIPFPYNLNTPNKSLDENSVSNDTNYNQNYWNCIHAIAEVGKAILKHEQLPANNHEAKDSNMWRYVSETFSDFLFYHDSVMATENTELPRTIIEIMMNLQTLCINAKDYKAENRKVEHCGKVILEMDKLTDLILALFGKKAAFQEFTIEQCEDLTDKVLNNKNEWLVTSNLVKHCKFIEEKRIIEDAKITILEEKARRQTSNSKKPIITKKTVFLFIASLIGYLHFSNKPKEQKHKFILNIYNLGHKVKTKVMHFCTLSNNSNNNTEGKNTQEQKEQGTYTNMNQDKEDILS